MDNSPSVGLVCIFILLLISNIILIMLTSHSTLNERLIKDGTYHWIIDSKTGEKSLVPVCTCPTGDNDETK